MPTLYVYVYDYSTKKPLQATVRIGYFEPGHYGFYETKHGSNVAFEVKPNHKYIVNAYTDGFYGDAKQIVVRETDARLYFKLKPKPKTKTLPQKPAPKESKPPTPVKKPVYVTTKSEYVSKTTAYSKTVSSALYIPSTSNKVLDIKVSASKDKVRPGDTVRIDVTIQNVTSYVVTNLKVDINGKVYKLPTLYHGNRRTVTYIWHVTNDTKVFCSGTGLDVWIGVRATIIHATSTQTKRWTNSTGFNIRFMPITPRQAIVNIAYPKEAKQGQMVVFTIYVTNKGICQETFMASMHDDTENLKIPLEHSGIFKYVKPGEQRQAKSMGYTPHKPGIHTYTVKVYRVKDMRNPVITPTNLELIVSKKIQVDVKPTVVKKPITTSKVYTSGQKISIPGKYTIDIHAVDSDTKIGVLGGYVYIDGKLVGRTGGDPKINQFPCGHFRTVVSGGKHTIVVCRPTPPGYQKICVKKEVVVNKDMVITLYLPATAPKHFNRIIIQTNPVLPHAGVYLYKGSTGQLLGYTNEQGWFEWSFPKPGTYTFKIMKDNKVLQVFNVTVSGYGKTVKKTVTLKKYLPPTKGRGKLHIIGVFDKNIPHSFAIEIDGRGIGSYAEWTGELTPGYHRVVLYYMGKRLIDKDVLIKEGEITELKIPVTIVTYQKLKQNEPILKAPEIKNVKPLPPPKKEQEIVTIPEKEFKPKPPTTPTETKPLPTTVKSPVTKPKQPLTPVAYKPTPTLTKQASVPKKAEEVISDKTILYGLIIAGIVSAGAVAYKVLKK